MESPGHFGPGQPAGSGGQPQVSERIGERESGCCSNGRGGAGCCCGCLAGQGEGEAPGLEVQEPGQEPGQVSALTVSRNGVPSPPGRIGTGCLVSNRGRGRHSQCVQCACRSGVQHGGPVGLRAERMPNFLGNWCDYDLHRHCAGCASVCALSAECVDARGGHFEISMNRVLCMLVGTQCGCDCGVDAHNHLSCVSGTTDTHW
eukprot:13075273-Alexandrium_andersonii.AAC.1